MKKCADHLRKNEKIRKNCEKTNEKFVIYNKFTQSFYWKKM